MLVLVTRRTERLASARHGAKRKDIWFQLASEATLLNPTEEV